LYSHFRGCIGWEVYKVSLAFSVKFYFPLTGWITSSAHELHDESPAYGYYLRTKGTQPELPWFSGQLTNEQNYWDKR
ncbi:inverse autotransporter beta domain-containing protein, partial [Salmonella enterica]|uniref:inverse autotransporter beta domain-containing protein n=1 Tax=Salmonella enterica TaxID=28901 RepID=UPI003297C141